ncbi:hypothetical protein ACP3TJ_01830 [Desulforudis sp. 1088]|uniref:hypothetical protein n=1 Tax=unclassified Candidatus Desulforudis TaxID=2635950 RepID=UPI00346EFC94
MQDEQIKQNNRPVPEPMPPEPQGAGFSEDLADGLGWMYATDDGIDDEVKTDSDEDIQG